MEFINRLINTFEIELKNTEEDKGEAEDFISEMLSKIDRDKEYETI
jgi:hypothetical protein